MVKTKSAFRKKMNKTLTTFSSPTINVGFSEIDKWVDMGNFAMNRIMSGQWKDGLLYGRNYVYYGESGSGKSLQAAYAAANAQKAHDAFILWIDVEKATDDVAGKKWLSRAGVDISEENFAYTSAATLGDIKKIISSMSQVYREAYEAGEESSPLVIVVDSWSAALTTSQWEQAQKGEHKGDQGQKAKQTGDVVQATTHLVAHIPILTIGIGHVMDDQDPYSGRKHKTTGGHKLYYMASGCLLLSKKELKSDDVEDAGIAEHYKKLTEKMTAELRKKKRIVGHTCIVDNLKSRAAKPFERIQIQVPFNSGMDPYSGLFELLMNEGAITNPSKGWYAYQKGGEEVKFQKGKFREHADAIMVYADSLNPYGLIEEDNGTEETSKV